MASALLIPLLISNMAKNNQKLNIQHLPHLFIMGFFGITANLAFVFEGLKRTSSIEGVLIGSLGPLITILLGALILKEFIPKEEKIGLIITFIGVLILILEPIRVNGHLKLAGFFGNLLILGGNLTWSVYVLYSKKLFNHRKHYSPLVITTFLFLTGLVSFAPLSFLEYLRDPLVYTKALTFPAVLGVAYMGVISSVVAYFLYEYALERVDASETAVYGYLGPIFAAPLAFVLLKETISPLFMIAAAIIVAGIAVIHTSNKESP